MNVDFPLGLDSRYKGLRREPGSRAQTLAARSQSPAGEQRRCASGATWWQKDERLAPASRAPCALPTLRGKAEDVLFPDTMYLKPKGNLTC